jgi:hypothetical protein
VGLVARALEAAGVPTVSLTSAWSITAAVRPPRAAYVDYPLGHTAGKPLDPADQRAVVLGALGTLDAAEAGRIIDLGRTWSPDDAWKDRVMRPGGSPGDGDGGDSRSERRREPVWQHDEDRLAAEARHASGPCGECVGAE